MSPRHCSSARRACGLPLGRWYPKFTDGLTVAVTEKRTREEIDGLVGEVRKALRA